MPRHAPLPFALFAAAAASPAAAAPGWFACDAVDGPFAAFVARPDKAGIAAITMVDRRNGRTVTQDFIVGPGDPGAGNVYWSLSQGGREVGAIHGINPGMVDGSGPGALPPIKDVKIGRLQLRCRWLGDMQLLAVGRTRSVVVTREAGRLVYRSFDFAKRGPAIEGSEGVTTSRPTLAIDGGTGDGAGGYRFDNRGYTYHVTTAGGRGPASVAVTRERRTVGTTAFLFFAAATGGGPALSRADLWTGEGVEPCRRMADEAASTRCFLGAMRRGGATPAAVALAARLAAEDTPGYLSAWRQAGPVAVATITYPYRANTNDEPALIPATGDPILVDKWAPAPADEARADWRRLVAAHPQSSSFPPGEVAASEPAPGRPFAIRVRTPWRDCHACEAVGAQVVRYDFDAGGRLTGTALESVQ